MTKKERIEAYIEGLPMPEKVRVHNAYCEAVRDPDSEIRYMDDLPEDLYGLDVMRIICMVRYGGLNPSDQYYWYNGEGNLSSSDYPDSEIYPGDIATTCVLDNEDFDCGKIREILDEEEGDDE